MRRLFAHLLALAALACASAQPKPTPDLSPADAGATAEAVPSTPDEGFRAQKPEALPSEPAFVAPVPTKLSLANGAQLLVVENHAVPIVAVEIAIQAGVDVEPLNRRGLSNFVALMLTEGTKTRSSIEIDIARERLAAQLFPGNGSEADTLHLNALRETLPEALALTADVLLHPAFRPADVERLRGLLLTGLAQKKGNNGALAADDMNRLLWGDKTAWGLPAGGTPQSIKAITVRDLRRFHQEWFVPNNAIISVSGDITPAQAKAALDTAFATWKSRAMPKRPKLVFPALQPRQIVFTDVPNASQSQVWVGWRAPKPGDPNFLPLVIGNNVLGGLFTSRLNRNLREEKAFSYGVRSRVGVFRESGTLVAAGGIIAQHTAEAVGEYEKELTRLRSGDLSDEEIARAKEAIIRGLPSSLETNDAVSGAMASLVLLGRPLDYYATLAERVRAVTKEQVAAAIAATVKPDEWPVVVVGPKALVLDPLKQLQLGKVTEVAAE